MAENPSHIEILYRRFSNAEASEEEVREMFRLIARRQDDPELISLLEAELEMSNLEDDEPERRALVLRKIKKVIAVIDGKPGRPVGKRNFKWPLIIAAASVVGVLSIGLYFYTSQWRSNVQITEIADQAGIRPGKQGATLILANGKKITLADAQNGELAKEAGVVISKTADGQVVYEILKQVQDDANKMNTLTTAKGETYQLRLPDGSLVWLNAASSLTYPASLNEGGLRKVTLEGEAYFEIAKDKAHPFVVESRKQRVTVLGTHFNVNAYADEPVIKTTLLEGSVRVSEGTATQLLVPGCEAVNAADGKIVLNRVDTELAVAWKDNNFVFANERIETVMKMLERWYDVQVVYQGEMPQEKFRGAVSRFDNIAKVLNILQSTGSVRFKIEGKKIYVSK
ncbi:MAG: DUF4974 domain-containing protein [Candidatus Pedobacter colombiensis]|uniref:DUF4974 domain-containing protein n=1 Tax=Candidatus Pedobacter colombiensis TaxID=3121371 RepID=A0AAJ5W9B6_9SPHI|nr:FecR family protein [Pedobacter sp.]WEK20407.1 MAG: DUF4974 domain-containing protein [Pedobacter sp.]